MPMLALTVSLFFSAFLIVQDCRRRRSVSSAVWIPTAALMVLGSRPLSVWLSGGQVHLGTQMANDQAPSVIDELFFFGILGGSLLVVSLRRIRWRKFLGSNPALMLLYLYFAISILWSSDPIGSTKRVVKDFGLLAPAGLLLTEKDPLRAMRAVYARSAYLLLPLSVVFIRYFPALGRQYSPTGEVTATGITTQKNSLGEIVLLSSIFLIWDYLESRPASSKFRLSQIPANLVIFLAMGGWLLHVSQSKTSLLCVLIATFLVARSGRLLSPILSRAVLIAVLCLPFIVLFSQKFGFLIAPLVEAVGRNMTFTGRTSIWEHITLQTVNPLIGSGFWNFWGGPGGYKVNLEMNSVIPNAHDGYIDLYLDGGILGLILLFMLLFSSGNRMIGLLSRDRDLNHYTRMRFAVLIVLIVYNISETTFFRVGPLWMTSLLMFVQYPAPLRAPVVEKGKGERFRRGAFTGTARSVPQPRSARTPQTSWIQILA